MTRLAPALLLLVACGREDVAANSAAAEAAKGPPVPAVEGDVSAAERLVRQRLGNPQGLAFSNPRRGASEGVPIVCGDYEQGAQRGRYIVVDRQDVFVETEMQAGEMDRAFGEFCGGGNHG